jgi:four helix bundle protein
MAAVTPGGRRLRAWRRAFDLAAAIYRITGRMEDARTNGLPSRMRRTALRVPALITRATARRERSACREDLVAALRSLEDLERQLGVCRALVYLEPGEMERIWDWLGSSRDSITRIAHRVAGAAPANHGTGGASAGGVGRPAAGFEDGGSG